MASITNHHSAVRVYLVNGVGNWEEDLDSSCEEMEKLIAAECYPHHNYATTPDKLQSTVGSAFATAAGVVGTVCAAPLVATVFFAATVYSAKSTRDKLAAIQEYKRTIAYELAQRIADYLNGAHYRHVVICGHSQGAAIVALAIRMKILKRLVHRISIMTFGGLEQVRSGVVGRVANFVNKGDHVARIPIPAYRTIYLESNSPPLKDRDLTARTSHLGHSFLDYLKNSSVKATLRDFTSQPPRRFQVMLRGFPQRLHPGYRASSVTPLGPTVRQILPPDYRPPVAFSPSAPGAPWAAGFPQRFHPGYHAPSVTPLGPGVRQILPPDYPVPAAFSPSPPGAPWAAGVPQILPPGQSYKH